MMKKIISVYIIKCFYLLMVLAYLPSPLVLGTDFHNKDRTDDKIFFRLLESGEFGKLEEELKNFSTGDQTKKYYYEGLLELYRGDYENAYRILSNFYKNTDIGDNDFYTSYSFYMKSVSRGFQHKESKHFIIRYFPQDELMADYALLSLEKICENAHLVFGWIPSEGEKVIVEIYPDKKSFANASTLGESILKKSGTVGICKFNRIMILSPRNLALGYRWVETLAHEYTHFVINRLTQFNCPLWVHEGISRWADTVLTVSISSENYSPNSLYLSDYSGNLLFQAIKNKKFIPFDKMKNSLVYLPSSEDISLSFAEVADFINHVVRNYGVSKLKEWLNDMRYSMSEKKSFSRIFGVSLESVQKNWKKNLTALYSSSYYREGKSSVPDLPLYELKSEEELLESDIIRYVRLGDELRRRGNFAAAYEEYKKAWLVKKNDGNPVISVKMARALVGMNRLDEAKKLLLPVIEGNRNYLTPYVVMMEIAMRQNDEASYLNFAREVFEINPFYPGIKDVIVREQ